MISSIRKLFSYAIGGLLSPIIGLFVVGRLSFVLHESIYGEFVFVSSMIHLFSSFLSLQLQSAYYRYHFIVEDKDSYFRVTQFALLILSFIGSSMLVVVALLIFNADIILSIASACLLIAIMQESLYEQRAKSEEAAEVVSKSEIAASIIYNVLLLVLLEYNHMSGSILIWAYMLRYLFKISFYSYRLKISRTINLSSLEVLKNSFSYSKYLIMHSVANNSLLKINQLYVAKFIGLSANAQLALAEKLVQFFKVIVKAANNIAAPSLFKNNVSHNVLILVEVGLLASSLVLKLLHFKGVDLSRFISYGIDLNLVHILLFGLLFRTTSLTSINKLSKELKSKQIAILSWIALTINLLLVYFVRNSLSILTIAQILLITNYTHSLLALFFANGQLNLKLFLRINIYLFIYILL